MHSNTIKQNHVYAFVRMSFGSTAIFKSLMAINVGYLDYSGFATSPIISSHHEKVDFILILCDHLVF